MTPRGDDADGNRRLVRANERGARPCHDASDDRRRDEMVRRTVTGIRTAIPRTMPRSSRQHVPATTDDADARSLERRLFRSLKARADTQRSSSQRMADWMTNAAGSNVFLLLNAAWFLIWTVGNARIIPGLEPFDPFPFGLLTTIVSLEAILLSVFVLMAQNRSARIDQLRQEFDLQINLIAESELTKLLCLVAKIAEKQGIDVASDRDLQHMLAPTNVEKIERVLERQIADSRRAVVSDRDEQAREARPALP